MNRKIALNLGVNNVDPFYYNKGLRPLNFCANDAGAYHNITTSLGFTSILKCDDEVSYDAVVNFLKRQSGALQAGDFLFLSFSGHGGKKKDKNKDEPDGMDETWCLYDKVILDDEINQLLANFEFGVRIWVVSDSCFSGTIIRDLFGTRAIPLLDTHDSKKVRASVRLFSGSRESQVSREKEGHGEFTRAFLNVWSEGKFTGVYNDFFKAIVKQFTLGQLPQHVLDGTKDDDWDQQKPFE